MQLGADVRNKSKGVLASARRLLGSQSHSPGVAVACKMSSDVRGEGGQLW